MTAAAESAQRYLPFLKSGRGAGQTCRTKYFARRTSGFGARLCTSYGARRPTELIDVNEIDGGWGGIRTHGSLARSPDFKSGAFNRSATHPVTRAMRSLQFTCCEARDTISGLRRPDRTPILSEIVCLVFDSGGTSSLHRPLHDPASREAATLDFDQLNAGTAAITTKPFTLCEPCCAVCGATTTGEWMGVFRGARAT